MRPFDWLHPYSEDEASTSVINTVRQINEGTSFAITAGPRMGKTSFILSCIKYINRNYPKTLSVYLDLNSFSDITREEIFTSICIKMTKEYRRDPSKEIKEEFLSLAERIIESGEIDRILVIFDRIESIYSTDWGLAFLREWRAILSSIDRLYKQISLIIAGGSGLYLAAKDIGSPIGNILRWKDLHGLDYREFEKLIADHQFDLPTDIIREDIFKLVGPHPMLLQFALSNIQNSLLEENRLDLQEIKDEIINRFDGMFSYTWRDISGKGKSILNRIVSGEVINKNTEPGIGRGQGYEDLKILVNSGFIRIAQNGEISVSSEVLITWLSRSEEAEKMNIATGEKVKIFISYTHRDEEYRNELVAHLALLSRQELVESWYDHKILAGSEIDADIIKNLDESKIIILLISSDFINSDYCYSKEMFKSLEKHSDGTARVIPVIVRSVDWSDAPFSKLKMMPRDAIPIATWGDKDEAYKSISQEIRRILKFNR
ncbi:TIR domain-containing protein [Deinococcus petrolearius]|uniref:TIR domain-containing protein n=1 Tax=Deinococcus petrolearius TaxID=1751295 RepID=A0ABW1DM56_9DEIO